MTHRTTILAAGGCLSLFLGGFAITGQPLVYVNLTALAVVASGTLAAALLAHGLPTLEEAWRLLRESLRREREPLGRLVRDMLVLRLRLERQGPRALEDAGVTRPEMVRALRLVSENFSEIEVREVLGCQIQFDRGAYENGQRVFRNMAGFAPAFGLAGSVIGLVGLLAGIADTALILKSIPVALVSTLYGILASNFLLLPAAERIRRLQHAETRQSLLILEGAAAMARGQDLVRLVERLNSMLPPSERISDPEVLGRLKRLALLGDRAASDPRETVDATRMDAAAERPHVA